MSCVKPIKAYKLFKKTKNGKSSIVFQPSDISGPYELITLPCGQCIKCRIRQARDWALRCTHEARKYDNNCMVTITYNEDSIDQRRSLNKKDLTNFIKLTRKKINSHKYNLRTGRYVRLSKIDLRKRSYRKVRYFQCGEYGEDLMRPHHHIIFFNWDFEDKYVFKYNDEVPVYRSDFLESIWTKGFSSITDLTPESIAYVTRYCIKKITGDQAATHYIKEDFDPDSGEISMLEPEYVTMSRKPGIGKDWFDEFGDEVYVKDFCTNLGKIYSTPRYYDKLYDEINPVHLAQIKEQRKQRVKQTDGDLRLMQIEKAVKLKFHKKERKFENGNNDLLNF